MNARSAADVSEEPKIRPTGPERHFNVAGIAAMHVGAVIALYMGARPVDIALAGGFYLIRMWAITAGYHRYFSHRAYKTSRFFQFVIGLLGTFAVQKGPLWWAATHRRHHRESDKPTDVHSPVQRGFWWSHMGWILAAEHEAYDPKEIKDLYKYPELRWLDRYHVVPVLSYLGLTVAIGGLRGLCWWFCVSTVVLMHATFTINSLSHVWGKRVYATSDDSRNNWMLAILTLGEGWHNNHHRHMHSANQGFFWWQIDVSYYVLKALSFVGITWDLKKPPQRVLDEGRLGNPAPFAKVGASVSQMGSEMSASVRATFEPAPMPQDAE
jgi:stearoyl-CoA desaturase (Delta-9 desaturase)